MTELTLKVCEHHLNPPLLLILSVRSSPSGLCLRRRLIRGSVVVSCLAQAVFVHSGYAEPVNAYLDAKAQGDPRSAAVDIKGRRYDATKFDGLPPWLSETVKTLAPAYSYDDRNNHRQGAGIFRLTLDPTTGVPREVRVLKSTGFPTLDATAVAAFGQWRWRPGKWRQIDIPVNFTMSGDPPPRGALPLPRGWNRSVPEPNVIPGVLPGF
jgi:TonB family protein